MHPGKNKIVFKPLIIAHFLLYAIIFSAYPLLTCDLDQVKGGTSGRNAVII